MITKIALVFWNSPRTHSQLTIVSVSEEFQNIYIHVLFRNYKMDENSRPRKQARIDTFLIPRRDEKSQR